jgi:hypothetical protein
MGTSEALCQAAELLATGDWEAAHVIVQDDPSPLAAWMHGIVHTLEGDESNARYWYGQAGRPFPGVARWIERSKPWARLPVPLEVFAA